MSQAKRISAKKGKDSRGGGNFIPFNLHVLRSQVLANLSPYGCKLLLDLASQLKWGQNGDASAAFEKVLKDRGWRSKATLQKAINELLESGLIIKTRQGGLHQCSLYGLGWIGIDDCKGKIEIKACHFPIHLHYEPYAPKNKSSSTPRVPMVKNKVDLGTPRVLDG